MPAYPPTYADVLLPTDGSSRAQRGVDHGLKLAGQADATVHAMHVIDERTLGETPARSPDELAFERAETEGRELAESVAERARDQGLDATTNVSRGRPSEEIVDYAESEGVDLIVMGRAGEGCAETPHIGTVTDHVLRSTDVPVFPV